MLQPQQNSEKKAKKDSTSIIRLKIEKNGNHKFQPKTLDPEI